MQEKEKIKQIYQKYIEFFNTTPADVALSEKGEGLFYFTEPDGEKTSLTIFNTAKELEAIILHEVMFTLKDIANSSIEHLDMEFQRPDIGYSLVGLDNDIMLEHVAQTFESLHKELSKWTDAFVDCMGMLKKYYQSKEV